MISNRESKFIKSLQLKKFRNLEQCFLVEGEKSVCELLRSDLVIRELFTTAKFMDRHDKLVKESCCSCREVTPGDLARVGTYQTNDAALAVVEIPSYEPVGAVKESVIALDAVKDPGNLGTIIRIADWYGFNHIVCSQDSVDCYNAKVIASTMGSFTRVRVTYQDLHTFLPLNDHVYGATLAGSDLHQVAFIEPAVLLFGNESTGISRSLLPSLNREVRIAGFGQAESLNVGVSVAVFCDNFKRLTGLH